MAKCKIQISNIVVHWCGHKHYSATETPQLTNLLDIRQILVRYKQAKQDLKIFFRNLKKKSLTC